MYTRNVPARVSVHDPSVVWDAASSQYYIFGSHRAQASSKDLYNWSAITPSIPWGTVNASGTVVEAESSKAFLKPQVTTVTKGGQTYNLPSFNAQYWSSQASNNYDITGNLWAPDIIYNPVMKKWCQYLSVNGDNWASSIILLTADEITGPYVYQAPVVISGFNGTNPNSYKSTDMEIVLGTLSALPERYSQGRSWGTYWPNNIDPCVFYDEMGKLWMTYGSWSGGIFALELDEKTGLRDYDVEYPLTEDAKGTYTSDPYFGKKIAGGYYVSGEASYVQHIGDYYYLYMTYGGLAADGGYMMEVFRSENPDGPYVDAKGNSAVYTTYQLNFGTGAVARGAKILGAYGNWGFMTQGAQAELSQGHNSAITDEQGRSFLVYHTRFNNGTEGHQVRVHQLFTNQNGWLCAAPFEFNGETTTDKDIASKQAYAASDVAGDYQILIHRQLLDHKNKATVSPVAITLHDDGTVSGTYRGSWELVDGTSYLNIKLGGISYQGVVVEQQMEPYTIKAIAFSAMSGNGVSLWGYKMREDHALAYNYNAGLPVSDGDEVKSNLSLPTEGTDGVSIAWRSSEPDVLSADGVYNPAAMTANSMPVDLYLTMSAGKYELTDTISVTVTKNDGEYHTGLAAYYNFDNIPVVNQVNNAETALLKSSGANTVPSLTTDASRSGSVMRTTFGAAGNESYAELTNSLQGLALADGFTVSLWVNNVDGNLWDDIFSFFNSTSTARLYMTGNTYVGYNNAAGNWIDLNHPTTVTTDNAPANTWTYVTLTMSRTEGPKLYINGKAKEFQAVAGSQNTANISEISAFNYDEVVSFVASCPKMYLGYGSFWGSLNASYDDLAVYSRVLSSDDVALLAAAAAAGQDITAISTVTIDTERAADANVYNLNGQRVGTSLNGLPSGIYIKGGKKYIVK